MLSFASALHRGLGRALQRLERQPVDDQTRALVLDACLNDRAYDSQIEGSRAEYLLEAAQLAGLISGLTSQLTEALQNVDEEAEDHWSLQQRVDLLVSFVHRGDLGAEAALDQLYLDRLRVPGTLLTMLEDALFDLYGPVGLLRVVQDRAARHGDQPDHCDQALLRRARNDLDPEAFSGVMEQARSEPDVRMYLDHLETLTERARADRRPMNTELIDYAAARRAVTEAVARKALGCPFALRSARLTEEALLGLAANLEEETDPDVLWLLMCAFQRRTYPNAPERLLVLAQHFDLRVMEQAFMALSRVQHPEVRELAMRVLSSDSPMRLLSADLLTLNFEEGDEELLCTVLKHAEQADDDLRHAFCSDVRKVTEVHPTPAMLTLLADTYPSQPCAHCRHQALLLLTEHATVATVPAWLQTEARLDADPETRALVSAKMA